MKISRGVPEHDEGVGQKQRESFPKGPPLVRERVLETEGVAQGRQHRGRLGSVGKNDAPWSVQLVCLFGHVF